MYGHNIIIADDDLVQRDLYAGLFRDLGYIVTTADDGQAAWEQIQKDRPDLVCTGNQMPRMTGFELIDKLRANKATERTPVIIFSHLGRDEDRQRAHDLPLVSYMVKGFNGPADILKKAKEFLGSDF